MSRLGWHDLPDASYSRGGAEWRLTQEHRGVWRIDEALDDVGLGWHTHGRESNRPAAKRRVREIIAARESMAPR